jgi:hypothetical protein
MCFLLIVHYLAQYVGKGRMLTAAALIDATRTGYVLYRALVIVCFSTHLHQIYFVHVGGSLWFMEA